MARKKRRSKSQGRSSATSNGKPAFPVLDPKCEQGGGAGKLPTRAQRSRALAACLKDYDRQRLAAAETHTPMDFRAQHRAVGDDRGAVVERFGRQIPDSEGRPANPHRVYDTLAALHRSGSIDGDELEAGRQFEQDFRLAQLNPLHAPNLQRISGTQGPGISDAMLAGREKVARVMATLGGYASPPGAALWAVLGMGGTIKEFAQGTQYGGRSLDEKVAKGVFVAALGVLASHYGLKRF